MENISIVIPNYNGLNYLEDCLSSVKKAVSYYGFRCEVIVIDNGSSDGSINFIETNFSFIKVLKLNQNLDFAKAMNIGIKESKHSVVIGLNNDVIVDENFINPLVRYFKRQDIFAVGSKMLLWDKKTLNFGQARAEFFLGLLRIRFEDAKKAANSLYACGGAFAVDREKFLTLGGFDEDLRYLYEDVDLCWRAWRRNWKTIYEPKSVVYHKYHGTTAELYGKYGVAVLGKKNYFLFIWKNTEDKRLILHHIIFMPFWIIASMLSFRFYFIQGLIQALKSLPFFLEKRKEEKHKKRVLDDHQILLSVLQKHISEPRKSKVLHISKFYHPFIGGQETHLHLLLNELKKSVDTEILTSNIRFKTVIENLDGIKVSRIANLWRLFSMPLVFTLPLWLNRKKSDILHFHLPYPLAVLSYLLIRPRGKLIVSYHNDIIRQRIFLPFYKYFLIRFLKRADAIIVTSRNLIRSSSMLRKFRDKCRVIPHGVDFKAYSLTDDISNKVKDIKRKYNGPMILFVGRLVYYKGLEYLIEAMKDIEANLLIIGNGPYGKKLKKIAIYHGVSDKIKWLGAIPNNEVAPYYYASDIFVLPSHNNSESFGMTILEAQACGRPVVSTDLPTGVKLVNINEKTGLLVPPKDKNSLAKAINKLLNNVTLSKRYGENAHIRAKTKFTKEIMAEKTLAVYAGQAF